MSRFRLALVAIFTASLAAAQASSPFAYGNVCYQRGEFEQARQQYLAQQGPVTPALLYNLGNVALKLEQPGWAILYYERAALARPRDADLQANLAVAFASRRVPPEAEAPGWLQVLWQGVLQHFTLNELTGIAMVLYLLSCGLLVWRLRGRHFRRRYAWVLHAALGLLLLFGALTFSKWHTDYDPSRAVMVADAALYGGPAETFPAVRTAYQGELGHILRQEGFWREVRLENGTQGWSLQSAVEPVVGGG